MNSKSKKIISFFQRNKSSFILILFILFSIIFSNGKTLSMSNLQNLMMQISIQGIVGLGMTFSLICGEFDLSVGSIYTFAGITFAKCLQVMPFFYAAIIAVSLGAFLGLINGFIVNKMKINSFIATLATSYIYKGMADIICNGEPTSVGNNNFVVNISKFKFLGIPIYLFILLFFSIISIYVLSNMRFGRNIYATGGNYEVAKNSGINVDFYKIMSFVIVCASAALAGVLLTIRLQSATPIAGDDLNLVVIGAVIIGGTSTDGGIGSAQKSIIGMLIFGIIINTMNVLGIAGYYQQVVRGVLTVAIIASTSYSNYRKTSTL